MRAGVECRMIEQRYICRGKFANTRFEKNCLSEYAEVFKALFMMEGTPRIFEMVTRGLRRLNTTRPIFFSKVLAIDFFGE